MKNTFDTSLSDSQAPAVNGKIGTTSEAARYNTIPTADTAVGKQTLKMIDYFLEMTKGKLPISFCDVQSPLNAAGNIIDINNFMMDFYMDPEAVTQLMNKIADLIIEFTNKQIDRLQDTLVYPGHGFASSRVFDGFGMSDDNIVMLSNDIYSSVVFPSFEKTGTPFECPVLHSCGNWGNKIETIKNIKGLKTVDAAFSAGTDPDPCTASEFSSGFANSGIVVNARIVGGL